MAHVVDCLVGVVGIIGRIAATIGEKFMGGRGCCHIRGAGACGQRGAGGT